MMKLTKSSPGPWLCLKWEQQPLPAAKKHTDTKRKKYRNKENTHRQKQIETKRNKYRKKQKQIETQTETSTDTSKQDTNIEQNTTEPSIECFFKSPHRHHDNHHNRQ